MKVLYISYDGMTDQLGQSQVLPYIKGLSAAGHTIHLISFEKPAHFAMEEKLIRSICKDAGIEWHPLTYTGKPPVISSIYDFMRMKKFALHLHRTFNFDLIHCRSYLPALTGLYLKRKTAVPFLFDMRGFWADERVEGGLWDRKNPLFNTIYQFFKKQERTLFQSADGIISLTHKAVPIIKSIQEGKSTAPIQVIPCCVDTHHFNPSTTLNGKRNEIRAALGIDGNTFTLCYLGGIGTWYLADEMFDFFKRLLLRFPDAVFLFITKEHAGTLKKMALSRDIPADKIIVKPAARKEIPELLSAADASIYFIMNSFSKQASSPTKQGEVMSMGLPLICNTGVGDSSDIVLKTKTGYVLENFSDAEYDRIVNELHFPVSDTEKLHIREVAIQHFSLEDGVRNYLEIYRKIAQE